MSMVLALGHRVRQIAPLATLVVLGGCFATRNDVRIVQSDVATLRTELLRNDTEQREALTQAIRQLSVINDSLARISARTVSIQGDVRGEMRSIKEQLLQIQALVGQSQANLNRMRSEIEERNRAQMAPPPYVPGQVPPTTVPPTGAQTPPAGTGTAADSAARAALDSAMRQPGPAQLYQSGVDLMKRGSNATARTVFQELLSVYPSSDLAPDAQYYIAESLDKEKNLAGADAAYGAVVTKYPDSRWAATALYKQAQIAVAQGNTAEAKKKLEEVIKRFPRSNEAELAADQLKQLR
jgi:tol-pal system protein YbgF